MCVCVYLRSPWYNTGASNGGGHINAQSLRKIERRNPIGGLVFFFKYFVADHVGDTCQEEIIPQRGELTKHIETLLHLWLYIDDAQSIKKIYAPQKKYYGNGRRMD